MANRKRQRYPLWYVILCAGFVFGFFLAVSVKTGHDISEEGISQTILHTFCGNELFSKGIVCGYLWFWDALLFIVGVIVVLTDMQKHLPAYIAGLFLGLLLVWIYL